jgi:Ca2+-binding RTX toxin-like protein
MRVRAAIRLGLLSLAAVLLGTPAQAMLPIGPQFRVSQMGPDGNTTFGAFSAAIAYNPQANQFLVVWSGADTTVGEREIWGRLVDTAGNPLGGNFRISDMGPDGDANYDAFNPAVTYNAQANEYLVVWSGDDNTAPLVEAEFEIFGQRLSASGTEVGTNDSRLSDMGPDGNVSYGAFNPAVTYNAQANEYLVVWSGDDNTAPLVEAEFEIFGQRLSASGTETGTNDFRLSDMGPDGNVSYGAFNPAVTYNAQANEYLVVWSGDDNTAPLVEAEFEIFGQRLSASGTETGTNDFRLSDMGPDGNANYDVSSPSVAYNDQANEYLVVWSGDDDTAPLVDNETEIFGQRLSASGTETGTNDFRLSQMGPDGNASFAGENPAVIYGTAPNEYLVVWSGDDNTAPLVDEEFEIFGQRLATSGTELDTNDFRISVMGPDGATTYGALNSAVAYNEQANEYLVAWEGDTDAAPLVDDELEIWARRSGAGPPAPCTITGTPGNDVITGTAGDDRICARGGNDRVFGRGGNDRIVLGPGRDRAFGGPGRDVILGGKGPDRISGGGGRDRLFGERGRDVLFARDRVRDLVHGGRGFDRARVDRRRDTRRSIERLF